MPFMYNIYFPWINLVILLIIVFSFGNCNTSANYRYFLQTHNFIHRRKDIAAFTVAEKLRQVDSLAANLMAKLKCKLK